MNRRTPPNIATRREAERLRQEITVLQAALAELEGGCEVCGCDHEDGAPCIDRTRYEVSYAGRTLRLGLGLRFDLLECLARTPGVYVNREALFDELWDGRQSEGAIRKVVHLLRQLLCGAGMDDLAKAIVSQPGSYALDPVWRNGSAGQMEQRRNSHGARRGTGGTYNPTRTRRRNESLPA